MGLEYHKLFVGVCVFRFVSGDRLDDLLTWSPHTPVADCTTTVSRGDGDWRWLVLTNTHLYIAWISIERLNKTGQHDKEGLLLIKCHLFCSLVCSVGVCPDH